MLAVLLMATVWLGRCVSCRTLAAQEPVHDCCQKDSCHRDSSHPPAGKQCPHQALALEHYAKAGPAAPAAAVAAVPLDAASDLAPQPRTGYQPVLEMRHAHAPPDLYLCNSVLLI